MPEPAAHAVGLTSAESALEAPVMRQAGRCPFDITVALNHLHTHTHTPHQGHPPARGRVTFSATTQVGSSDPFSPKCVRRHNPGAQPPCYAVATWPPPPLVPSSSKMHRLLSEPLLRFAMRTERTRVSGHTQEFTGLAGRPPASAPQTCFRPMVHTESSLTPAERRPCLGLVTTTQGGGGADVLAPVFWPRNPGPERFHGKPRAHSTRLG